MNAVRMRAPVVVLLAMLCALPAPALAITSTSPSTSTPDPKDKPAIADGDEISTIWLVADGAVRDVYEGKSTTTPAAGSLGIRHTALDYGASRVGHVRVSSGQRLAVFFGVTSNMDSLQSSDPEVFGQSLSNASLAGRKPSFFVDYEWFRSYNRRLDQQWGFRVYGGLARTSWRFGPDTSAMRAEVVPVAAGARFVWVALDKEAKENSVILTAESGPTVRFVDFKGPNAVAMQGLALNGENHFFGWDLVATLQVKSLVTSLYLPWMFKRETVVKGLRGATPSFTLGIQTDFLKIFEERDQASGSD